MCESSSPTPNSFFTSTRERRLWTYAVAVLASIALTLVFGSTLNSFWHSQTFSAVVFLSGMALVAVAVISQGLNPRARNIEIGVTAGIAAVYLMFFLRLSLPERSHLIEYSVLAIFIYEALVERASHGRVRFPWLGAIVLSSLIGVVDELVQLLLPSRHFATDDILFNTMASALAVISVAAIRAVRRLL